MRWLLVAGLVGGMACSEGASTSTSTWASTSPSTTTATSASTVTSTTTSAAATAGASATLPAGSEPCVDLAPGDAVAPKLGSQVLLPPGRKMPDPILHGVDASSPAAWKTIRDAGYVFGFAQAALGSKKNEHFAANWRAMRACGLARGAYHFLTPTEDGASLARVLVEQLGQDRGELPPTIDLEKPPNCEDECCEKPCSFWQGLVRSYLDELEKNGIDKVLVYFVEPFFNQCLCGSPALKKHPLFLAAWPKFDWPEKVRTGGFGEWTFYQYKGNVRAGGGVIDLDVFRGTREDLEALRPK